MKKVGITGEKGLIGQVLTKGLGSDYDITPINSPEVDVRDYSVLLKRFQGLDSVIHLAWNTKVENYQTGTIDSGNNVMTLNVYKAARESGVPRVIMASSVHADMYRTWQEDEPLSPTHSPVPDSPYGASKVFMEALGRHYAAKELEVICIRFGGVNLQNKPSTDDPLEGTVWFSHRDCVALVKACIDAKSVPDGFCIVYGVSDNDERIVDTTNPFGWQPKHS